MTRRLWPIIFCAFLLSSCAKIPPNLMVDPQNHSLAKKVSGDIHKTGCHFGVAAIDLKKGRTLEWNADQTFEAASVIKIAILAEALSLWQEGKLDLAQRWTLTDQAKAAGSGVLDSFDPGLQPTNLDLLRIMIIVSDNTAANHWIDALGYQAINQRMAADGLPQIQLVGNRLPDMNPTDTQDERWKGLRFGEVTPKAVAEYYQLLYQGKLLNQEGTKMARDSFSQQHYTSRIPRLLLEKKDYQWGGKTGTLEGCLLDSGIITTPNDSYALAIFADQIPESKGASDKAAEAMGEIAYEIVTTWELES